MAPLSSKLAPFRFILAQLGLKLAPLGLLAICVARVEISAVRLKLALFVAEFVPDGLKIATLESKLTPLGSN